VQNLVDNAKQPAIYRPLDDAIESNVALLIRLQGKNSTERLQQFAASLQQGGSAPLIENVREDLDRTMAEPRFTMRILVTFAGLGVLLAAIGLFGLISYTVTQRTREIGVRMALGATRGSIARLIVGEGVRLSLAGIGLGLLGAIAATRLIQSLLYGVSRIDPFSFGVGALLLLAVSVIACVGPVLRATGVDPALAVRGE
jgi:putative ABC transport system permease protein